jgi:hypothetical protein
MRLEFPRLPSSKWLQHLLSPLPRYSDNDKRILLPLWKFKQFVDQQHFVQQQQRGFNW